MTKLISRPMDIIKIYGLDELPEAAERIAGYLDRHSVVAFYGHMGAGKTTLIKEICNRLGVSENVSSPTFALVNQYMTGSGEIVNHFDFYRIDKPEEAFDIGYEEYVYSGDLCLIEWPEKIEGLLPGDTLKVMIEADPEDEDARTVTIL